MSTPSQPDSELDDLLRYAPKWARDPANVERRRELRLGEVDGLSRTPAEASIRRVEASIHEFKRSLVIDRFEVPHSLVRSLDPTPVPPPWSLPREPRRSAFARTTRFIAIVSVSANVALLLAWPLPGQLPAEGWVRENFAKAFGAISSPSSERQAAVAKRPAPANVPPKIAEAPSVAPVTAMAAQEPPPKIAEAPSVAPVTAMAAQEPPPKIAEAPSVAPVMAMAAQEPPPKIAEAPSVAPVMAMAAQEPPPKIAEAPSVAPVTAMAAQEPPPKIAEAPSVAPVTAMAAQEPPPKIAEAPSVAPVTAMAAQEPPPKIAEAPSVAPVMAMAAQEPPPKIAEAPSVAPVTAMAAQEPPATEPPAAAGQKVSPPATDAVVSPSAAFKTAATDGSVRRAEPLRQIDPDEVQFLFQRGEEFVAVGDFAAARIVFERAAEAGHARAAFALAATYDPLVLRRFGIKSLTADLAKARAWYQKAGSLGSAEASRRIELLANLEN